MAARSEEARPVVVAWSDVERVVAAVVERKQRLRELEATREGLRSSLAKAIEERSEQATKWELQEEKQVKRQHLIVAVRRQKEELESLKQHSADLRTGLKARQSRLNKAKVQLKEAGHRLQEADQILEAHGKRLGEKLKSEVRGLQLRAIADLTVVFPIRELTPRVRKPGMPSMRSLEALHEAGLESHGAMIGAGAGSSMEPRDLGSDTGGRHRTKAVQETEDECEETVAVRAEVALKPDSGSGEDAKRHASSQESSKAHRADELKALGHPPGRSTAREGNSGGAEEASSLEDLGRETVGNGCAEDVYSQGSGQDEERCEAFTLIRVPSDCEGTQIRDEVNRAAHFEQPQERANGNSRVKGSGDGVERHKGEGHAESRTMEPLLKGDEKSNDDGREFLANTQKGSGGEKLSVTQDPVSGVNKGLNVEGTFLMCGIPLLSAHRLRHAGLLDEAQRQQQAAALGMCAQVVHLVAFYSRLTLRYPVQWKGSNSTILDPCPPVTAQQATATPYTQDITLPLFPESVKNFSRCTFAMVLLAKDVEQILSFFGFQWSGDRHAILENLSYLMKGEVPSPSVFSSKSSQKMTGSIKRQISCPSFKDSV